jgi:hypothetical protein
LIGDLAGARRAIEWQLEATKDHPAWGVRDWTMSAHANALNELAWVELLGGELERARATAGRGIDVARGVADLENQWTGLAALSMVAFFAGEPEVARAPVQRLAELAERVGSGWLRIESRFRVATQLLLEGDAAGAAELLEGVGASLETGAPTMRLMEAYRAESLRRVGDIRRARVLAEQAHAFMKERGLRIWLVDTGIILARIVRDDGGVAEAERIAALLAEADAVIAATGAHLFTPFVLVERAELARLGGDDATRLRVLGEAHRLFAAMGATGQARKLAPKLKE